jgi:hypothetical protein
MILGVEASGHEFEFDSHSAIVQMFVGMRLGFSIIGAWVADSPCLLLMVTWIGTVTGQVFSIPGSSGNAIGFIRRMAPGRSELFYERMDLLATMTLGPILVFILWSPETAHGAMGAGLAWNHVVRGAIMAMKHSAPPGPPPTSHDPSRS